MLCFPVASCETEASNESGIHNTGNQERDFKIESGIAIARRREEGEGTAQNISSRQEENRSGTEKEMGEDQGREQYRSIFSWGVLPIPLNVSLTRERNSTIS